MELLAFGKMKVADTPLPDHLVDHMAKAEGFGLFQ